MRLRPLVFPEAKAIRRIAASIAGAGASPAGRSRKGMIVLTTELQSGRFFRMFPWTGRILEPGFMPSWSSSNVTEYFGAFNWDGHPVPGARPSLVRTPDDAQAVGPESRVNLFEDLHDIFD